MHNIRNWNFYKKYGSSNCHSVPHADYFWSTDSLAKALLLSFILAEINSHSENMKHNISKKDLEIMKYKQIINTYCYVLYS